MVRERVVAAAASRFVVLVSEEKTVSKLGTRAPIPVEVIPFATPFVKRRVERLSGTATLRRTNEGSAYVTDNQNEILDVKFAQIDNPQT